MRTGAESTGNGPVGVALSATTPFPSRSTSGTADGLAPDRLDRLARAIAGQLRRALLTAEETAYVWRRARAKAGIRGRPVTTKRLPDVLSADELRRLLAEAYRDRPRDGLLIRLLFESAVRVAEASRIDAADVDAAERTMKVVQGKGGKDRLVFMTEDLAQLVRLHLDGRPRGPLFLSNRGTRLSVRRIQTIVHAAARRAGIAHKRISPHTLRRTWATVARNVGMPLDSIQALLGHSDPKTTLIYTQRAMARTRQEYDAAMTAIAGMAPESRARVGM